MDRPLADDEITFVFPLWTIAKKEIVGKPGLGIDSIIRFKSDEIGTVFPLFRKVEQARAFIKKLSAGKAIAIALRNALVLRRLLIPLRAAGCQNVGFDVVQKKGRTDGRFYPISEVIRSLPPDHRNN